MENELNLSESGPQGAGEEELKDEELGDVTGGSGGGGTAPIAPHH